MKSMIRLIVVMLVISITGVLGAAGNQEAENGNAQILQEEFSELLDAVESGEIAPEEAKESLSEMQNRFRMDGETQEKLEGILEKVCTGEMKADEGTGECEEALKTREQIQNKTQDQNKVMENSQDKSTMGGSGSTGQNGSASGS